MNESVADRITMVGHIVEKSESLTDTLLGLMEMIGSHAISVVKGGKKMGGLHAIGRVLQKNRTVGGAVEVGVVGRVVVVVTTNKGKLIAKMGDGTVGTCLQCLLLSQPKGTKLPMAGSITVKALCDPDLHIVLLWFVQDLHLIKGVLR